MLENISYYLILGKPIIFYTGILAIVSFLFTAFVGLLNYREVHIIPFKWHPKLAVFSLAVALIHGLMGILLYF